MAEETSAEARFERFIAVLIALTTIFTSITAFLEHLASSEADRLNRVAQELSIEATTERVNGELRFSYDWQGAYQTWRELDLMIVNAEQVGDTARAEAYRAVRDQVNGLSPLLQQPYFDEATIVPDSLRYESDLYLVSSTHLREEFDNTANTSKQWSQISNAYVLQLTLYAVALSLYGLSITIHSFIRWLFVGLASLFVVVNILWGMVLIFVPIDEIPAEAIDAYANGVGLAYQGKDREAIDLFTEALTLYPNYANAANDRGFSKLVLGDLAGAAADFEAVLAAGQVNTSVLWNLGWTYYLLGEYDRAVLVNQQALNLNPSLIGVRFNQGLAMLAQGRTGNALQEYNLALEEAVRQVTAARGAGEEVPSSLWVFMDAGSADLQSLLDTLDGAVKPWTQSPQAGLVRGNHDEIRQTALELIGKIKAYTVSLELDGTPPPPRGPMNASTFSFVQEVLDEAGNFVDYEEASVNQYGINEIGILFDFSGFQVGQQEVWKVYYNGFEDTTLRVVDTWEVGESGQAIKFISFAHSNVFILSPGEYTVELYIDAQLLQSGTFWVSDP